MEKYILKTMLSEVDGLYLLELPTGIGKTYKVVKAISEYIKNPDNHKKIIFLTTLNKNLPVAELKHVLGQEIYEHCVIWIRSNFDEVTENLEKLDVPDEFHTQKYESLYFLVKKYNTVKEKSRGDTEYLQDLRTRIEKADHGFRSELTRKLKKAFPNKKSRLKAIHNDKNWRWIGKLYPAVFTDEYQILIMSVNKFVERNSTLVEPSYEFLKSDMLNHAIIFIDEFDATKKAIQNVIAEKALKISEEYLSIFKQIYHSLNPEYLTSEMQLAYQQISEGSRYSFQSICKEAQRIADSYHVELSFKTLDEFIDHRQIFLLKDATYHTAFHNHKQYISGSVNQEENRVDIFFENRAEFFRHRKNDPDNYIPIYLMLREIDRFLLHFRIFLLNWAGNYRRLVNQKRNPEVDELTLENAVSSILKKISPNNKEMQMLLESLVVSTTKKKKQELLPDNSFYHQGMEIFELEDSDSHYDSTDFKLIMIRDTPEKIIAALSEKATVFGISATAELPSVTCNYDLAYLREKLSSSFHPTPLKIKQQARKKLEKSNKMYEEGKIRIHTEIVQNRSASFNLREVLEEIFNDPDDAMVWANKIELLTGEHYYQQRYCNIARAMRNFWTRDIQSMLCLGMALPRAGAPEMNEELLIDLFQKIREELEEEGDNTLTGAFVVLKGENYDENKNLLIQRLGNGEKIFILSTYQTIGAGQNLQYPAPDLTKLVQLLPKRNKSDRRFIEKDIDAIYLGDVTNQTTNTYSGKKLTPMETLDMLFQIGELKQHAELSFEESDQMIKLALKAYTGSARYEKNLLYGTDSVKLEAARQVMQAVGRMCRTYQKAPDIYLDIEESLLEKLSSGELKKHILPPEMQAIINLRESLGAEPADPEKSILRQAEKISSFGWWNIRGVLAHDWTEADMNLWRELRYLVLRYPTADKNLYESNELVHKLFITAEKPQNRYLYSQYSDFEDVTIDFGTDKIAFRNSGRAKEKADNGEVLVYEMSEEESGLKSILQYPGMRAYFEENGFQQSFRDNLYMMSPVLFHNIYKGALGEEAGRFILRSEMGIELKSIDDPERFEFFDFEMSPGVYVDFKNWKASYQQDRQSAIRKIKEKLDSIGGKRAYIINLLEKPDGAIGTSLNDGSVIEIPCLIDRQGRPVKESLRMIREEDFS